MSPARDGEDPGDAGAIVRPSAADGEAPRPPGARFDLALVSARPGTKVAPAGVRSLVRYLVAADVLAAPREGPFEASEAGAITEIRAQPGSYAHSIFHPGPARPATTPAFREAVLRFGSAPVPLGFGDAGPGQPVYFALELRGSAFDFVHQRLIDRLYQVLYLRAAVFARPVEGGPQASASPETSARSGPSATARSYTGGVGTVVHEKG